MKILKTVRFAYAGLLTLILGGCTSAKQMTYLLDMQYNTPYEAQPAPELIVQPGDLLGISVSSEEASLAAPFNSVPNISDATSSPDNDLAYAVDQTGCINFPVIGKLKVEGCTLLQIQDDITSRITRSGYIKEPVVNVVLKNFCITVVGNTGNSVLPVKGNSINLFQVIAQSGGVTTPSKIKEVMVVRTENGMHTAYAVNLQSKDVFSSPVFYLRQNDMVYVKPHGSRLSSEGQTVMTIVGSGLTLGSIITNFLLWSSRR